MKRHGQAFGLGVSITKEAIVTGADSFSMNYRVETQGNASPKDSLLGVEFSFCMPGCNGPVCHYEFPETGSETGTARHGLGSIGATDNLTYFSATDGYGGLRLVLRSLARLPCGGIRSRLFLYPRQGSKGYIRAQAWSSCFPFGRRRKPLLSFP